MINFAGKIIDFNTPKVMGVLNVTPDSFSDGGELLLNTGKVAIDKVLQRAEEMQTAGASFIDIGGESTKPGAKKVSLQEEMDRVLPLIEKLKQKIEAVISIDTSSPEIMLEASNAGAGLINDIRALQKPGALEAIQKCKLPVCLMHMQGSPESMQKSPHYENMVSEITSFLEERVSVCVSSGISRKNIIIDPGFGFGKTLEHNLELLGRLYEFKSLELPMLIGLSRKQMLGLLTGKNEKERLAAGISAAVIGLMQGVKIIRSHDVAATVDAVKVYNSVNEMKITNS